MSLTVKAARAGQCLFRTDQTSLQPPPTPEVLGRKPLQSHRHPKEAGQPVTERTIQGTPDQSLAKTPEPPQVLTRGRYQGAVIVMLSRAIVVE